MRTIPEGEAKKKRRSHAPAGPTGARRVIDELSRRGFDARLANRRANKYDILVGLHGSPTKPVNVRTVHVPPWYVRSSHFAGAVANQVTVFVLLGHEKDRNRARFFVTRNSNLRTALRQPPDWRDFALIDLESVEQYEDNWDLLKP